MADYGIFIDTIHSQRLVQKRSIRPIWHASARNDCGTGAPGDVCRRWVTRNKSYNDGATHDETNGMRSLPGIRHVCLGDADPLPGYRYEAPQFVG